MVRDYRAYFTLISLALGGSLTAQQMDETLVHNYGGRHAELHATAQLETAPELNSYGEPVLLYTVEEVTFEQFEAYTTNGRFTMTINKDGVFWRSVASSWNSTLDLRVGQWSMLDGNYSATLKLEMGGNPGDSSNTVLTSSPFTWSVIAGVSDMAESLAQCHGLFYTYTNTYDVQMNVTINGSFSMNGHSMFPGEQLVLYQLDVSETASVNVWESPTYGDDRYFQSFVTTVTASTYDCEIPPGEEVADGGRDPDAPPSEEDFPDPLDPATPTALTPEQVAAAKDTEKQVRIIREGMSGASVGVSKEDLDGLSVVIGEGTEPGGLVEAEYGQARSDAVDEMGAGWINAPNIGTGGGGGTPHGGQLIGGLYIPEINLDSVLSTPTASAVAGWMRIACAWGLTLGWIMYVMKEVTRHLHAASQVTQVQSSFDFVNVVPGAGSIRSLAMAAVIVAAIAILPTTIYTAASTLVDGMSIASLSQSPYSAGGSASGGTSITSTLATLDLFFPLGLSIAIGVQGVILKFVGGAAFAGTVGIIKVSVG